MLYPSPNYPSELHIVISNCLFHIFTWAGRRNLEHYKFLISGSAFWNPNRVSPHLFPSQWMAPPCLVAQVKTFKHSLKLLFFSYPYIQSMSKSCEFYFWSMFRIRPLLPMSIILLLFYLCPEWLKIALTVSLLSLLFLHILFSTQQPEILSGIEINKI